MSIGRRAYLTTLWPALATSLLIREQPAQGARERFFVLKGNADVNQEHQRNQPIRLPVRIVAKALGEIQRPDDHVLRHPRVPGNRSSRRSRATGWTARQPVVHLPALFCTQPPRWQLAGLRRTEAGIRGQSGNVRLITVWYDAFRIDAHKAGFCCVDKSAVDSPQLVHIRLGD